MSTPMEGIEDGRTLKKRGRGGDDRNPGSNSPAVSKKNQFFDPHPNSAASTASTPVHKIFLCQHKKICFIATTSPSVSTYTPPQHIKN